MNHFEQRQHVPNFVLLKMANEMPAQVRRQQRNLCPRFLHAAFTEQRLSRSNCFADFLGVVRLRNRNKLDLINCATSFRRRLSDLFGNTGEVFSNRTHCL